MTNVEKWIEKWTHLSGMTCDALIELAHAIVADAKAGKPVEPNPCNQCWRQLMGGCHGPRVWFCGCKLTLVRFDSLSAWNAANPLTAKPVEPPAPSPDLVRLVNLWKAWNQDISISPSGHLPTTAEVAAVEAWEQQQRQREAKP